MRPITNFAAQRAALAVLVHAQSARGQASLSAEPKRAPLASPADVEPAVDVGGRRVALIDAPAPAGAAPATTALPPWPRRPRRPRRDRSPKELRIGSAKRIQTPRERTDQFSGTEFARDGYARSGNHVNNGQSGIA